MSMSGKKQLFAAIAVTLVVLQGCSSMQEISDAAKRDQLVTAQKLQKIEEMKTPGAVVRRTEAKLAGEEMLVKEPPRLPKIFTQPFTYVSIPQPLPVILGEIGRRVGMATRIQDGRTEASSAVPGMQPYMAPMPATSGQQGQQQQEQLSVDWHGDLKGLLDHLAMRTGMFWKIDAGEIYFFRTETKAFYVNLPQGLKKMKASVGLSGVGGGGSSASAGGVSASTSSGSGSSAGSVSVDADYEVDAYDAIKQAILSILGQQQVARQGMSTVTSPGAPAPMPMPSVQPGVTPNQVAVNAAFGTVTVTANPIQMERVEQYIRTINERFAQNVLIDIKVYNVAARKGANLGASLLAAYQDAANRYKFTLTGNPSLQPNVGTPGTLVLDYTSLASRWLGSQITLQALQSIGDVSLRTSGQVLAANGQPTPLQVANEVTYLASAATTIGQGGTTITSLTPGSRTIGLTANFLPMILGDNRILLQYQINMSRLLGIRQFTSGGQSIQMPSVASQSLQQQTYVRDGQSIVLFGFEQETNDVATDVGLGGGSRNAEKEHSMLVIVMEVYSGK